MNKYLFIICLFFAWVAHSEGVLIGRTIQINGNTPEGKELALMMNDMDTMAANRGNSYAQANLANRCLKQKDYICAYKWASLAVSGDYWWTVENPIKILSMRDSALDHLSEKEREIGVQQIKDYYTPIFNSMRPVPPDNTKDLNISELQGKAEKGDIKAMGNLSKKCVEKGDYSCAYKWSTLASMGFLWWGYGEEILSIRDKARRNLTESEITTYNKAIMDQISTMLGRKK